MTFGITLSKCGFIIPKITAFDHIINKSIKDLTVEPYNVFNKTNKNISFEVFQDNPKYIIIPKYYGIKNIKEKYVNQEILGKSINISFKGYLRTYQQDIINKVIPIIDKKDGGILSLPCAAGKTVMALYLISHYKVKSLIIVHKMFLLNQWIDRIKEFTDARVGIIKQNQVDTQDKDIVIGMLQSISKEKYDKNIFEDFGLVVFDEAHHAPSQYFSKALPLISAKKTIGLSATPKRTDKLEKVLFWYFGDVIIDSNTINNNSLGNVNIYNYSTDNQLFKEVKMRNGEINRSRVITNLTNINERNKFIVNTLLNVAQDPKRKIIILSDRIEHLKILHNLINEIDSTKSIGYYIGKMKQSNLDNTAKTCQIIFGSYSMAAEGLDIPELNTLFMVTPRKEIEQSIGRIYRKINYECLPKIFDFVDMLPSFINQGRVRMSIYKKLNIKIQISNVYKDILDSSESSNISNIVNTIINDPDINNSCDFID